VSTVLSLSKGRAVLKPPLELTAGTAGWLLGTFTLVPKRFRDNGYVAAVSFVGLLVSASLLVSHDKLFLIFMITTLFHAVVLRPVPVSLLGLATASLLLNTLPSGGMAKTFLGEPMADLDDHRHPDRGDRRPCAGMLDERQRLSQEIHDTLTQGFSGIITQLEAAEQAGENQAERHRISPPQPPSPGKTWLRPGARSTPCARNSWTRRTCRQH
jgi:signal transduction histidine kinase